MAYSTKHEVREKSDELQHGGAEGAPTQTIDGLLKAKVWFSDALKKEMGYFILENEAARARAQ